MGPEEESSKNDESNIKEECPSDMLDPITYEKLVEYLDYELPQQQQQQKQEKEEQPSQQPVHYSSTVTPIAPAPPVNNSPMMPTPSTLPPNMSGYVPVYPAPPPTTTKISRQPTLLPKPIDSSSSSTCSSPLSLSTTSLIQPTTISSPLLQQKAVRKSKKRPASSTTEDKNEDQIAADEDKRRRNTAASARFRIKKKMREQAMEQNVQEMKAKSDRLQNRVNELELEVKWLRNLLIEKRENNNSSSSNNMGAIA